MSFLAEAELIVPFPPEVVFDRLLDHPSWAGWMPPTFRPVGPAKGKLETGTVFLARLAWLPLPVPIKVRLIDRPHEITWGGGSALLKGDHRFLFIPVEGSNNQQTKIQSLETWSGVLSGVLRPIVQRVARRVGRDQIQALAESLNRKA